MGFNSGLKGLIHKIIPYRTPNSTHELHSRPFYVAKVTVWFAVSSDGTNCFSENAEWLQERWSNNRSRSTSHSLPLFGLHQNVFAASVRSIRSVRSIAFRLTLFYGSTYLS